MEELARVPERFSSNLFVRVDQEGTHGDITRIEGEQTGPEIPSGNISCT